ncbi:hypothetical protein M0638_03835 [Roseomonas sp. NAR14]|uniref:Tetratricopeptide repeat protein n=1 Tax=Roseomonas acroporae TaxID=2937791 RepID=A0A9X1Y7I8_9PROT|nr:tetratricopeptide repeat-containing protein [Roseomonas acroporae]MCK8783512.1 hypothetical protein [Roseomonas acroporae]
MDPLEEVQALQADGLLLSAHDRAMAALGARPDDLWLRHAAVLTLASAGATGRALDLFGRLALAEETDPEIVSLQARLLKDVAYESAGEARLAMLDRARALYDGLWRRTGDGYHGINAAALSLLGGDAAAAAALARAVLAAHRDDGSYWSLATEAEAQLLAGEPLRALRLLERAAALPDADMRKRASTRRQIRRELGALGFAPEVSAALAEALPVPLVVHFVGHMPGEGFDAAAQDGLAWRIERALDENRVDAAFGALAAGADILFVEAMLRRGITPTIRLVGDVEHFARRSVEPAGGDWLARFHACLARCRVESLEETPYPGDDLDLVLSSRRSMGLARLHAQHNDGRALQMAAWDGVPAGENPSPLQGAGTAADVAAWQRAGGRVLNLGWPCERRRRAPGPPSPLPPRRPMAVLFGDLPRFSTLDDVGLATFYGRPMAAMGRAVEAHAPAYRNAWGDAVQAAFDGIGEAAGCAFALRDTLTPERLRDYGLPEALVPRLALDYGPLLAVEDAVQQAPKFAGRAMTRAARIEPVTPPGRIHTTQAFACEVALSPPGSPGAALVCEYAGRIPTAKGFGVLPLYALRRVGQQAARLLDARP